MKNPQKQLIFTCFPRFSAAVRTHASPYPRLTFFATVFVCTEHFLPAFSPLPRAGLFLLPFRPILLRTRRVNLPPNLPVKISPTLSACIFCTSRRSSRRTYFSPARIFFPSVCVRFSLNKPHARPHRRFRAADIRGRTPTTAESNRNRTDASRPFIFLRHTPHHVAFPRPPHQTAQAKST